MPNQWNISGATGGSNGTHLNGCHITVVTDASGTHYQFTKPNINEILATTPGLSLPTPPFNFPQFRYKEVDWVVMVQTLGANGGGTWSTPSRKRTGSQNGDYTAQSGGTVHPKKAAHSAKA